MARGSGASPRAAAALAVALAGRRLVAAGPGVAPTAGRAGHRPRRLHRQVGVRAGPHRHPGRPPVRRLRRRRPVPRRRRGDPQLPAGRPDPLPAVPGHTPDPAVPRERLQRHPDVALHAAAPPGRRGRLPGGDPRRRRRPVGPVGPGRPHRRPGLRERTHRDAVGPVLRGPAAGLHGRHLARVGVRRHRRLHPADRIAAIGLVAAEFLLRPCRGPLPVIAFHGTADPIVPYRSGGTGRSCPASPSPGAVQNLDAWARLDRCATASPTCGSCRPWWSGGPGPAAAHGSSVVLYTVLGGGHTWPGSPVVPLGRHLRRHHPTRSTPPGSCWPSSAGTDWAAVTRAVRAPACRSIV